MQPQENPARVLLGLHGNSIEGFFPMNLYCLECTNTIQISWAVNLRTYNLCESMALSVLTAAYPLAKDQRGLTL